MHTPYLLPIELLIKEYELDVYCTDSQCLQLLFESLPRAFYSVVNILMESNVKLTKPGNNNEVLASLLASGHVSDVIKCLPSGKVKWERVFSQKIKQGENHLISEIVCISNDEGFYILYLMFFSENISVINNGVGVNVKTDANVIENRYFILLKKMMLKIIVHVKENQYRHIIVDVYNPHIKKMFYLMGFNEVSKVIQDYVMPSSRMRLTDF